MISGARKRPPGPLHAPLTCFSRQEKRVLTIAIIVFVLWVFGLIFFKAAKGFIHLLLLLAVIAVLVHFFGGA